MFSCVASRPCPWAQSLALGHQAVLFSHHRRLEGCPWPPGPAVLSQPNSKLGPYQGKKPGVWGIPAWSALQWVGLQDGDPGLPASLG